MSAERKLPSVASTSKIRSAAPSEFDFLRTRCGKLSGRPVRYAATAGDA